MGVSQYGSHVSFETFAANSILHNKFDDPSSYSSAALSSLINKGVKKLTKPTRLDYALFKADKQMFTGEGGDRAGVSSVMVLFTDGRSHPTTTDYSNAVSSLKVNINSWFQVFSYYYWGTSETPECVGYSSHRRQSREKFRLS